MFLPFHVHFPLITPFSASLSLQEGIHFGEIAPRLPEYSRLPLREQRRRDRSEDPPTDLTSSALERLLAKRAREGAGAREAEAVEDKKVEKDKKKEKAASAEVEEAAKAAAAEMDSQEVEVIDCRSPSPTPTEY